MPASGSTTLNVYWGYSGAPSVSNGKSTFEYFNHFDGLTPSIGWSISAGSDTPYIEGSILKHVSTSGESYGYFGSYLPTITDGKRIVYRISTTTFDTSHYQYLYGTPQLNLSHTIGSARGIVDNGSTSAIASWNILPNYNIVQFTTRPSGGRSLQINSNNYTPSGSADGITGLNNSGAGLNIFIDFVYVTKIASSDPTVSGFSSSSNTQVSPTGNNRLAAGSDNALS